MPSLFDIARRQLSLSTHHIHTLPIVVLMPHSGCNCRCVMCDIWKANRNGQEISPESLLRHLGVLQQLRVRWVVLSGGEALMHSNLWTLCQTLKRLPARITLLSTGLLLERHAQDIVQWCDEVVVSLDGSQEIHDGIRNVPRAYERLVGGVAALKALDPQFPITARCVLQRRNYADLPRIIDAAQTMGLDQISFLAADVSTEAFNRGTPWEGERVADVALSRQEVAQFREILERTIAEYSPFFGQGFIAESPDKLRRLARYYGALNGDEEYPPVSCNAPWVSTVVEADGTVRPCFFHGPLGNILEQPLDLILNSTQAISFRRQLDMSHDPICRKCVCTLRLSPWANIGTSVEGLV